MSKMIQAYILIFLMVFTGSVAAGGRSYVYSVSGEGGDLSYSYVLESWDENSNLPNPCYNQFVCKIVVATQRDDGLASSSNVPSMELSRSDIKGVKTVGELGAIYKSYRQLPYSGKIKHKKAGGEMPCVTFFYRTDYSTSTSGSIPVPGAVCDSRPQVLQVCNVENNSDMTFDFGDVRTNENAEVTLKDYFHISCDYDTSVKIVVLTEAGGKLKLKHKNMEFQSAYVNLKVGDKYANDGLVLTVGQKIESVPISVSYKYESGLRPMAGAYSGSAVLVVLYP